jgi:hypothetical protein
VGKRFNLALIAAVAFAGSPVALAADGLTAVREHMLCVAKNAAKMDDGRKSAEEIAKVILTLCHSEHEAAMLASMPDRWSETPPDKAQEMELTHTIAAVEWYRGGGGIRPLQN